MMHLDEQTQFAFVRKAYKNETINSSQMLVYDFLLKMGVYGSLKEEKETGNPTSIYISPNNSNERILGDFRDLKEIHTFNTPDDVKEQFLPAKNVIGNDLYNHQTNVVNHILSYNAYNIIIVNAQLSAVIKEQKGFEPLPIEQFSSQETTQIYHTGKIGDLNIYCMPQLEWKNTSALLVNIWNEENFEYLTFTDVDEFASEALIINTDFTDFGGII